MRKTINLFVCDRCGAEQVNDLSLKTGDIYVFFDGQNVLGNNERAIASDENNDVCLKCFEQFEKWWYQFKPHPASEGAPS